MFNLFKKKTVRYWYLISYSFINTEGVHGFSYVIIEAHTEIKGKNGMQELDKLKIKETKRLEEEGIPEASIAILAISPLGIDYE